MSCHPLTLCGTAPSYACKCNRDVGRNDVTMAETLAETLKLKLETFQVSETHATIFCVARRAPTSGVLSR
jgi:hypothetical protein